MRLRFIFLLLFMAITSQAAVPVYKNDTLTFIPLYLLRSNITDSGTLTWTVDGNGRMTPNVIGGASSNAQPPSANLTNWSTIATQALRRAKTVFVSTNGNNTTGAREWLHLPFANPIFAKTNAQAGDLIWVSAGDYVCNDLLKNGVNYWFDAGARVRFTNNTDAAATARVVFDDRFLGAITSSVWGAGEFYFEGRRETNANAVGLAYLTNGGTFVFKGAKAEATVTTGGNGAGVFFAPITRSLTIDFPIIRDPNRFTEMYADPIPMYSNVQGVFWGLGDMHLKFDIIDVSWYGVWGEDFLAGLYTNTTGASYNAYVSGNLITASNAAAIYHEGKRQNYKMWVDVKEVRSDDNAGVVVFGDSSFYINSQKLISQGIGRDAIEVSGEGASLVWLTVQKVSSQNSRWLMMDTSQSGTIWADVQHFEDLGSMTEGIVNRSTSGGTINLRGGRGDITNAVGILHQSGNTFIDGLTLNVRGTTTNKWPVEVRTNGLTLKDVTLVKVGAGTTNSIVATNAAQNVKIYGLLMASTNAHPNINFTSGAFTVDGDVQ